VVVVADSLTHRQITRVAPNGNTKLGLRAPKSVLEEIGWSPGTHVHWRVVDDHLEARRVVLLEAR
jgi:antitoxin component of MazEF toxin-antitoxin module